MTPFDRFRQHVQDQPDAVAVITPYRTATYRKMWSRIERSTARFQGEWGIVAGDTIAYFGCAHLDALVMYFAAARCGARLLPLEHAALQAATPAIVAATGAVLVLYDDALGAAPGGVPDVWRHPAPGNARFACRPLSTLIATVCRHRESVTENSTAVTLLQWPPTATTMPGTQRTIPDPHRLQGRSLDQLAAEAAVPDTDIDTDTALRTVKGALFDIPTFGPLVLATLLAGHALTFGES